MLLHWLLHDHSNSMYINKVVILMLRMVEVHILIMLSTIVTIRKDLVMEDLKVLLEIM